MHYVPGFLMVFWFLDFLVFVCFVLFLAVNHAGVDLGDEAVSESFL